MIKPGLPKHDLAVRSKCRQDVPVGMKLQEHIKWGRNERSHVPFQKNKTIKKKVGFETLHCGNTL